MIKKILWWIGVVVVVLVVVVLAIAAFLIWAAAEAIWWPFGKMTEGYRSRRWLENKYKLGRGMLNKKNPARYTTAVTRLCAQTDYLRRCTQNMEFFGCDDREIEELCNEHHMLILHTGRAGVVLPPLPALKPALALVS